MTKILLLVGNGPSATATLEPPHTRWHVNWRGDGIVPDAIITADYKYPEIWRSLTDPPPLVRVTDDEIPYVTIPGCHPPKCRLGFSGPNALWRGITQGYTVVMAGFDLTEPSYQAQIPSWLAVISHAWCKGKVYRHAVMIGPLTVGKRVPVWE